MALFPGKRIRARTGLPEVIERDRPVKRIGVQHRALGQRDKVSEPSAATAQLDGPRGQGCAKPKGSDVHTRTSPSDARSKRFRGRVEQSANNEMATLVVPDAAGTDQKEVPVFDWLGDVVSICVWQKAKHACDNLSVRSQSLNIFRALATELLKKRGGKRMV